MFIEIIKEKISNIKFEIEDLEKLIDGQAITDYERGEMIDERYKLRGKLDGLKLALEIYLENN